MKSIKFLAALAVPAMFAACTNEELVAVQQEAQQSKEFVGAELIGKGVKLNLGTVIIRIYTFVTKIVIFLVKQHAAGKRFITKCPF